MSVNVVTAENFNEEVMSQDKLVLLDFLATWCGPCQMIAPAIAEIAEENADIYVGKVNVDESPELAGVFGIESIPTLVFIKDKKVMHTVVGYQPKEKIVSVLNGLK